MDLSDTVHVRGKVHVRLDPQTDRVRITTLPNRLIGLSSLS